MASYSLVVSSVALLVSIASAYYSWIRIRDIRLHRERDRRRDHFRKEATRPVDLARTELSEISRDIATLSQAWPDREARERQAKQAGHGYSSSMSHIISNLRDADAWLRGNSIEPRFLRLFDRSGIKDAASDFYTIVHGDDDERLRECAAKVETLNRALSVKISKNLDEAETQFAHQPTS